MNALNDDGIPIDIDTGYLEIKVAREESLSNENEFG